MAKLLTVVELGKKFGVHPETIRIWVRRGRVPVIRPTKKTMRFDLEQVKEALTNSIKIKQ